MSSGQAPAIIYVKVFIFQYLHMIPYNTGKVMPSEVKSRIHLVLLMAKAQCLETWTKFVELKAREHYWGKLVVSNCEYYETPVMRMGTSHAGSVSSANGYVEVNWSDQESLG